MYPQYQRHMDVYDVSMNVLLKFMIKRIQTACSYQYVYVFQKTFLAQGVTFSCLSCSPGLWNSSGCSFIFISGGPFHDTSINATDNVLANLCIGLFKL